MATDDIWELRVSKKRTFALRLRSTKLRLQLPHVVSASLEVSLAVKAETGFPRLPSSLLSCASPSHSCFPPKDSWRVNRELLIPHFPSLLFYLTVTTSYTT